MAFFETIRTMRQKQFLSQDALAKELDVTLSTVNRWETGKSVPNLSTMKKSKDTAKAIKWIMSRLKKLKDKKTVVYQKGISNCSVLK